MGAFLDGEWESICKLFTVDESPDLSCNFLEYSSPVSDQDDNLSFPMAPQFSENPYSSLSGWISNPPHKYLQTKTTAHQQSNSTDNCADNLFSGDILSCIDFSMVNAENDGSLSHPFGFDRRDATMHGIDGSNTPQFNNLVHNINSENSSSVNMLSPNTELTLNRKRGAPVAQESEEEKMSSMEPPKKNARVSKDATKKKRKATPKSEDDLTPTVDTKESNENADSNSDESSLPCVSEEINETEDSTSNVTVCLTSTGKKRASRGAATDPQSLYARKRRMRINERLKILQQLVPNGTKVDISTMLEEAFHYVKFLQLQIRLLSSDDMWMYAPLAYNGLDVGAYRRMPPFHGL